MLATDGMAGVGLGRRADGRNPGSGKMETFSEMGVSPSLDGFGKLE